MTALTGGEVKLRLDPELASAIDTARRIERSTRTGYIRSTLLRALRETGALAPARASTEGGAR